ncbi:MAG: type II toxin-antitoxin system RelE/ParE family toxin [Candidatus Promineifilaceae bacterium]
MQGDHRQQIVKIVGDTGAEAVFVLHCFQKKSKRGIATPKSDMDIIRARLKVADALAQELRNAKTDH